MFLRVGCSLLRAEASSVTWTFFFMIDQGCGSGSQLDPDSIGSVDPDPESGSGSRGQK
jgi:hypothetical protein